MKASKKALFTHFGYGLDSVETGLSLPDLLLPKHPQTSHSPQAMRCGKLPHPDTFTQAPTYCLYFFNQLVDIVLSVSENHFLQK